jgi:hypothetical protein
MLCYISTYTTRLRFRQPAHLYAAHQELTAGDSDWKGFKVLPVLSIDRVLPIKGARGRHGTALLYQSVLGWVVGYRGGEFFHALANVQLVAVGFVASIQAVVHHVGSNRGRAHSCSGRKVAAQDAHPYFTIVNIGRNSGIVANEPAARAARRRGGKARGNSWTIHVGRLAIDGRQFGYHWRANAWGCGGG